MQTECTPKLFEFEAVERRSVVAGFDGGNITSNAGALLLGQVDQGLGLVRRFADCFIDRRDARYVEHQVETSGWAAYLRPGVGLRGSQRPRRTAQGSDVCGAGRQVEPGAADRLRAVGWQEHAQSPGAHAPASCVEVSQDRLRRRAGRCVAGRSVPRGASACAARDRAGSRQHRHPAARDAGRPVLPRLL